MNKKLFNPALFGSLVLASATVLSACGEDTDKNKQATLKQTEQKVASTPNSASANKAETTDDALLKDALLKAEVEKAKLSTKSFVSALKGELTKAMQVGGPVNALTVCNTKAMPITEQVSKEQGAHLSRVSLKNRNPNNVPNDWQKTVLENFDKLAAKGEDVKTMAFAEIAEDGGKKQFRFMKALPTGKVCLTCHGEKLAPDVSAKLKELYPDDKATGYSLGQVRGAIVITRDL